MKTVFFSVYLSNLLMIVLLMVSDIATAANFEPDKIFISGEVTLIIFIIFNIIILRLTYLTGKINLIRLILTCVLILVATYTKFVHDYTYLQSFFTGVMYTIVAYLGTIVFKDRAQIVEKIHDFKKKGFINKIKFINGNILLIGPKISEKDNLFHYFRIKLIDQNYNEIKSDIYDGIGDDITDESATLIRAIKQYDKNDWRVGFINRYSGVVVIKYEFKEACRFLKNCDVYTKEEKIFSRVLFLYSDIPRYINEEGIEQKVFCD